MVFSARRQARVADGGDFVNNRRAIALKLRIFTRIQIFELESVFGRIRIRMLRSVVIRWLLSRPEEKSFSSQL